MEAVDGNDLNTLLPVVRLDGLEIHRVDLDRATRVVVQRATRGSGGLVVTPNADHMRMLRSGHPGLTAAYEAASLVLADGQPLVWAAQLQGTPLAGRVPGSDLLWTLAEAAGPADVPVAVIGGGPGVAERTAEVLQRHQPQLDVVMAEGPEVPAMPDPGELAGLARRIEDAGARIVFLGLGCPKQEVVGKVLSEMLPSVWFLGVGAAVDFAAGTVRRAPRAWQRLGVEWLYRLLQEPRRLARRYLLDDGPYVVGLLLRAVGARRRAQVGPADAGS